MPQGSATGRVLRLLGFFRSMDLMVSWDSLGGLRFESQKREGTRLFLITRMTLRLLAGISQWIAHE
jgi:hypothetical protein